MVCTPFFYPSFPEFEMSEQLIQFLSGFVTADRLCLFHEILNNRTNYLTLVLEDIYQTQNASAVVRSADCFGIQQVHVIENRNLFNVNPDVVRGASNWVTVNRYNGKEMNTPEAFRKLRENNYRIVVADPHKHTTFLEEIDLTKGKIAIVFGCERPGLSDYAKAHADEWMKIPMVGFTESLNISVSAAIVMHHLTNLMRKNADIHWQITEEERQHLLLEWLRKSIKRVDLLEQKFNESYNI
jgi:tRNA (guanosine-2'-O-)-methyltransferase